MFIIRNFLCPFPHNYLYVIHLIKYILEELKSKYVLTGKFQTDNLESRFGQYREMAGSNYYVSLQQILEAEKKLRIKSILKCHSEKLGEISIKDFITQHEANKALDENVDLSVFELILDTLEVDNLSENDVKILIYIGGYCIKKLDLSCKVCLEMFLLDEVFDLEVDNENYKYLKELNRGGLKFPTSIIVDILSMSFILFRKLLSKEYEDKFIGCNDQFSVFVKLSMLGIYASNILEKDYCTECNAKFSTLMNKVLQIFANICLNNYAKQCNDRILYEKQERKVKKFKT